MKAISGLTSMFDSLTKVVVSLLALGIAVSLLGGNVPFVGEIAGNIIGLVQSLGCLLYTSPSPRDRQKSRMPSSA